MKFDSSSEKLIPKLRKDWQLLTQSAESLESSARKCSAVGVKAEYTSEESESFDALTSRFARTSDIFTQKILKTAIFILREEANTFVDRMNVAEKLGMISSAEILIQLRDLRNSISHEYETEDLNKIYTSTLKLEPALIEEIKVAGHYFTGREWV